MSKIGIKSFNHQVVTLSRCHVVTLSSRHMVHSEVLVIVPLVIYVQGSEVIEES